MAIALLDWDLTRWRQPICFNLELMKIGSYMMQEKREITQMVERYIPGRYSETYLRKDYEDYEYPSEIFQDKSVKFGGLVFSEQKYKPMDLDIERSVPDTNLYRRVYKFYRSNAQELFSNLVRATHVRLSLDEETIWDDWYSQFGDMNLKKEYTIILHDQHLTTIKDSYEVITDLRTQFNRFNNVLIGNKFPLELRMPDEYVKWVHFPKFRNICQNDVYFPVEDELLPEVVGSQHFKYCITSEYYESNAFKYYYLVRYYKQLIYLLNKRSKIIFEIEDGFLDEDWMNVIHLINAYSEYCYKYGVAKITLFGLDRRSRIYILKEDMEKAFRFLQKENYDLFTLLYECINPVFNPSKTILMKGGY